jgi:hypothetical protein
MAWVVILYKNRNRDCLEFEVKCLQKNVKARLHLQCFRQLEFHFQTGGHANAASHCAAGLMVARWGGVKGYSVASAGVGEVDGLSILVESKQDSVQPSAPAQKILPDIVDREEIGHGMEIHSHDCELDCMAESFDSSIGGCENLRKAGFNVDSQGFSDGTSEQAEACAGIHGGFDRHCFASKFQRNGQEDTLFPGRVFMAVLVGDRVQGSESRGW